jgi:hypothetical protein
MGRRVELDLSDKPAAYKLLYSVRLGGQLGWGTKNIRPVEPMVMIVGPGFTCINFNLAAADQADINHFGTN